VAPQGQQPITVMPVKAKEELKTMGKIAGEFKTFLLRGNVVDLAVAVVVGAAFSSVVKSLVDNMLTPLISIPGKATFGDLTFHIRHSAFHYGRFLNDTIAFLMVSFAVFFFVVKPINRLMSLRKTSTDSTILNKTCPECLSSIPHEARRCAFCTSQLPAPTADV
jgi:large conductance mechanosensitive channel